MNVVKLYLSGLVRRWHQNPKISQFNQNNAAHQWGVTMILLSLNPSASRSLILATLTHDVGEIDAGDLAGPVKHQNPKLNAILEDVESQCRQKTMGDELYSNAVLSDKEKEWLHLCDKFEATLFVAFHKPEVLKNRLWVEEIERQKLMSSKLRCRDRYEELLNGCLS